MHFRADSHSGGNTYPGVQLTGSQELAFTVMDLLSSVQLASLPASYVQVMAALIEPYATYVVPFAHLTSFYACKQLSLSKYAGE